MGYSGDTYKVPCDTGGMNTNPNVDMIPPEAKIVIKNCNMHRGGLSTRGGVDPVNGTVISGAPQVVGTYQFRLVNGDTFIITGTSDGKIYKDYTTLLKDSLTINKHFTFETFNNTLYICNGADIPQTWNGSDGTTANLVNVPTDWTGVNYPKQMVNHGKGVSQCLWAYGCPSNPGDIYASENGSDDFSDVKVQKIPIDTGDGFGIVGMVDYGDSLICFGKTKAYIIDDTSTTRSEWGYTDVQWEGGVAHGELVCKTPNDVVMMSEDGEIYTITTVQQYGDYKAASLTKPSFFNTWIENNIDLSQIDKFHMIWDTELKAIRIFTVRKEQTQVDTCLLFFPDKGIDKGWCYHQYASTDFASCSAAVRVSTGVWKIYLGGYSGFVYQLETSTFNDDGVYYYNGFTTPFLTFDNSRITKFYKKGWLVIVPQGGETIKVKLLVDGVPVTGGYQLYSDTGEQFVDEYGNEYWVNTEDTLTVTASASLTLQNLSFDMGTIGTRIQAEVYNETINTSFLVSQILFDFKALSSRPQ